MGLLIYAKLFTESSIERVTNGPAGKFKPLKSEYYLRVVRRRRGRRVEGQGGRGGCSLVLPGDGGGCCCRGGRVVGRARVSVQVVVEARRLGLVVTGALVRVEGRVEGRVGVVVTARGRRRQEGEGLLVVGHLLLGHPSETFFLFN